jgi:hypothetical protein
MHYVVCIGLKLKRIKKQTPHPLELVSQVFDILGCAKCPLLDDKAAVLCTAQHSTAQHSTAQRSAAQRSAAQRSAAQAGQGVAAGEWPKHSLAMQQSDGGRL